MESGDYEKALAAYQGVYAAAVVATQKSNI